MTEIALSITYYPYLSRQQGHNGELGQQPLPSWSSQSIGSWQWYTFVYHLSKALNLFKNYKERNHFPIKPCTVLSFVLQSCPTLCSPMDCGPPGPLPMGILLATILEWVAMPSSRGSSRSRDQTQVSHIAGRRFNLWAIREAPTVSGKWPLKLYDI